jgi:hypothetical protein
MSVELRMSFVETEGRIGGTVSLEIGDTSTELEVAAAHGVSWQVNNMMRFAAQRSSFATLSAGRRENETNQTTQTQEQQQENDR